MPAPLGIAVNINVNKADIARVDKRLAKYQGAELAKRTQAALSGAASLLVGPIRAATPVSKGGNTGKYAHSAGNMRKKVRTRKLRNLTGENAAYYVGPSTYYSLFVQYGTNRQSANPFVQRTTGALRDRVDAYIAEKVTDLK